MECPYLGVVTWVGGGPGDEEGITQQSLEAFQEEEETQNLLLLTNLCTKALRIKITLETFRNGKIVTAL